MPEKFPKPCPKKQMAIATRQSNEQIYFKFWRKGLKSSFCFGLMGISWKPVVKVHIFYFLYKVESAAWESLEPNVQYLTTNGRAKHQ